MADLCFLAMTGKKPTPEEALPLQILVGLLISNGPGSISAQGAKGAVSADGPQTPERVQINKAMVGFLTHCGYSHGGNGFEGMAFLLDQFRDKGLKDPSDPGHGIDLKAMATDFAQGLPPGEEGVEGARRRAPRAAGRASPDLQGQAGQHRPARALRRGVHGAGRALQRLPRLLPRARAGAPRAGREPLRLLRQRRRGDRGAAARAALAGLPGRAADATATSRPRPSPSSSTAG